MSSPINLSGNRDEAFASVSNYLRAEGLRIVSSDFQRPWGGFFVLDESQAEQFVQKYFPEIDINSLKISGKLSPKILMVEKGKRLSWQYHFRRAEIWRLVAGVAGVVISDTDQENPVRVLNPGELVRLKQGERHRLVGLNGWGMIAEIWQHTDAANPSDESDIVRLQDDYGR
jgi:mannose-6-phosphate isomerase